MRNEVQLKLNRGVRHYRYTFSEWRYQEEFCKAVVMLPGVLEVYKSVDDPTVRVLWEANSGTSQKVLDLLIELNGYILEVLQ